MKVFLGIDTSNYTTSLCLLGEDGTILSDQRRILTVASGARGLRQSEALFQHVRNIPELTANLTKDLRSYTLSAIGVSVKPRPQADSYMPVFLPGRSLALSLSHLMAVPCFELTHQETHIWSGLASANGPQTKQFLSIHLSGGTTEMALVSKIEADVGLAIELLGETSDLHAGQFVDRLGVALGLTFPAGPALEQLALKAQETIPLATVQKEGKLSFSGPLTALERQIGQVEPAIIARTCLRAIARALVKWITWAEGQTSCRQVLIVGGVAANSLIRQDLVQALPHWEIYFSRPEYSVDNAYGAAYYAGLVSGYLRSLDSGGGTR